MISDTLAQQFILEHIELEQMDLWEEFCFWAMEQVEDADFEYCYNVFITNLGILIEQMS